MVITEHIYYGKRVDDETVRCYMSFCGAVNHNLFLEETNGRMECEHCHRDVQTIGLIPAKRIPIYTPQQIVEHFNNMNTQNEQRLD